MPLAPDAPIDCDNCAAWNVDRAPIHVFGNTWYVGVEGLSAVLIATEAGLVLLDGDLPQSAPLIVAHIGSVGEDIADLKLIAVSHAHYDHVGGVAALQQQTGAEVLASPAAAAALAGGRNPKDDPQAAFGRKARFAPVERVRAIADGEVVRLGELELTARHTPGHTPGGTSWTWRACEGERCLDLVYADSLNAVSAPGYRFTDHPELLGALRKSIEVVGGLPCDVLVTVHPAAELFDRLANGEPDPGACRAYADGAAERLEKRLAEEGD